MSLGNRVPGQLSTWIGFSVQWPEFIGWLGLPQAAHGLYAFFLSLGQLSSSSNFYKIQINAYSWECEDRESTGTFS